MDNNDPMITVMRILRRRGELPIAVRDTPQLKMAFAMADYLKWSMKHADDDDYSFRIADETVILIKDAIEVLPFDQEKVALALDELRWLFQEIVHGLNGATITRKPEE